MTHGWLIDRVKGGNLPVWETSVAHFTLADFLSTNEKINILGRQHLEALESSIYMIQEMGVCYTTIRWIILQASK